MWNPASIRNTFLKTIGIGFVIALALLFLNSVELYHTLDNIERTTGWTTDSHEAIESLDSLRSHMLDVETGQRGYVLTGQEHFLKRYDSGLVGIEQDKESVRQRPGKDETQRQKVQHLESLIDRKIELVQKIIVMRRDEGLERVATDNIVEESRLAMEAVRAAIHELRVDEERQLAARLKDAEHFMRRSFRVAMFGKLLAISVLLGLFFLIRRETQRRADAEEALKQANDSLESRVQERTDELVGANKRLARLSRELLHVQEGERRRIARDLHDELGQSLLALKLTLREAEEQATATGDGKIQESLEILGGVIDGVRSLALDLRPSLLDELGLVAAARWYVARQGERSGWATEFSAAPLPNGLSPEAAITCFRILQEALTNAAKHAQATRVAVVITLQDEQLMMTVSDNGTGFKIEEATAAARRGASIGLLAMEERAHLVGGCVTIASNEKEGTAITVMLPFGEEDASYQEQLEAAA